MTIEEQKLLTCQNCNEINDPGMLFCIHCGKGLTASAEKMRSNTTTMGGKCPACGKQDELNMRFCIFCSSPMVLEIAPRTATKFSWEGELADNGQPKKITDAALKFQDAVKKTPTKKPVNYLPIGLAAGAILGLFAISLAQDFVKNAYLSGTWPKKSLTVYTKHPFAQVTVYEPSDAKVFTMAETDAKGAVRFTNLEAGDYNMKITGNGLRTAFQQVKIDDEKATVIGYGDDKQVELQPASTSPSEGAPAPKASSDVSESKSSEGQPSEAKQSEAKPPEAKQSEAKQPEAKQSDPKLSEPTGERSDTQSAQGNPETPPPADPNATSPATR